MYGGPCTFQNSDQNSYNYIDIFWTLFRNFSDIKFSDIISNTITIINNKENIFWQLLHLSLDPPLK